ncbi:MAG: bifunctional phosphoglucose/phosphomannose isomerase [Hydrogenobacter sp.]|uniref:bifunctional phosphoglucose/phosphomannose isomerase n=1 Tax=Hydrogenobacter thermophilus TaxID=940 RepID=UPI0030F6BFD2
MNAQEMLENFPKQLGTVSCESMNLKEYSGVVFSGMGGSGIVGDLTKVLLEKSGISVPVLSSRGYDLPPYIQKGWAVVCISYSGNTEETLSVAKQATERGIKPICVSTGGKLKDFAKEEGLTHIQLPAGYPPRYALGFMLSALLSLVGMQESLKGMALFLEKNRESVKQDAQKLASVLERYIPVLYATPSLEAVAFRWKTQINENAKTLCYTAILPELHHNEIVGLDNPTTRSFCNFVLLFDPEDHPRVIKRVELTESILKDLGLSPFVLKGKGENFPQRLFYLIHMGDWVSFYLAQIYGYDPIPVKIIDLIKEKLSL